VSDTITGPYTPFERPFICPDPQGIGGTTDAIIASPGMGGAIDAAGFRDADGSRYVVYKVDGNSLAGGGPCGNGGVIRRPTPIYLAKVGGDGIMPAAGSVPVPLLDRTDRDGPLVEAPSLTRLPDESYALFYSSNCYNSDNYSVSWAHATSVAGPYTRKYTVLNSGMFDLKSPGGASMASDGRHMVFHANHGQGRAMYAVTIGVA
jgi:Glycosyl hydrolases family 43